MEAPPAGGFAFGNCRRNAALAAQGLGAPRPWSTGTTIAGIVFEGGVVLGADTRSTAGTTVADKNCEKIHYIAPNVYCCGAGTAADTENVTEMVASHLALHRAASGRGSRVVTALTLLKQHLFKYQGHISAALVLGGVDFSGPHLYTVYPHGSTDALPFCTMGSGSLNAMAVFEAGYRDGMDRQSAMQLVARAIRSGIMNDLGSGSNVDLCVITASGQEYFRNTEVYPDRVGLPRPQPRVVYPDREPRSSSKYLPGTTPVTASAVHDNRPWLQDVLVEEGAPGDAMETGA